MVTWAAFQKFAPDLEGEVDGILHRERLEVPASQSAPTR